MAPTPSLLSFLDGFLRLAPCGLVCFSSNPTFVLSFRNLGCAFLKYEKKDQALAALEAVNGKHKMEYDTKDQALAALEAVNGKHKIEEISKENRENREKQCDMHTLGPKSLVVLREEMQENDPNHWEPSQEDLYIEFRKRKLGRTYLTTNEETLENIEKMKALKSCEDGNNQKDLGKLMPLLNIMT